MTNVVSITAAPQPVRTNINWSDELDTFVSDVFRDNEYFDGIAMDWSFPSSFETAEEWLQEAVANVMRLDDRSVLNDAMYPLRSLFQLDASSDRVFWRDSKNFWHEGTIEQFRDFTARFLSAFGARAFAIGGTPLRTTQPHTKERAAETNLRAHCGLAFGWSSTVERRRKRPHRFTAFACGNLVMPSGDRLPIPVEPDDYVLASEVMRIAYNPTVTAPDSFVEFVRRMLSTRAERAIDPDKYLERAWMAAFPALGLQPPTPALLVFKGPGGDGKSFLFGHIVRSLVGDSSHEQMAANTLSTIGSERTSSGNYDLASFANKRVVLADDSQQTVISDTVLKALVAGSRAPAKVKARQIRQEYRRIDVSWQLVLCTNSDPKLSLVDNGLDRRLAMVEIEGIQNAQLRQMLRDPARADEAREYAAGYLLDLPESVRTGWTEDPQQLLGLWNFFAGIVADFDPILMEEPNKVARDRMGTSMLNQYLEAMFTKAEPSRDNYCRLSKARNIVRGALRFSFGGAAKAFSDNAVDDRLKDMGIAVLKNHNIRGQSADILKNHVAGPAAELLIRYATDESVRDELERALENAGAEQQHLPAFEALIRSHRSNRTDDVMPLLSDFLTRHPTAIRTPMEDVMALVRIERTGKTGEEFVRDRLRDDAGAPSIEALRFVRDQLTRQHARLYRLFAKAKRPTDDSLSKKIKSLDHLLENA